MEYVVGNLDFYVKKKDGKTFLERCGERYVVFFIPNERGGNYVYTNKLRDATKFKTLEKAQSVAEKYGFIVYKVTVTTKMEKL
ncbi:hypothetical protein FORC83_p020 (plasmid) [Campylobacter jejuni]|nr:hypothetical protein FORC83_p020 [Campylobacter jejuni]